VACLICDFVDNKLATMLPDSPGGWSDLSMVLRYTLSIAFEDCLEHYKKG